MLLITIFCLTLLTTTLGNQNCDKFGHLIYEDLGCTPNKVHGEVCPVSYNCNFQHKNGTCLFRNQLYEAQEPATKEQLEGSCEFGCFCGQEGSFSCAILECAEYWGLPVPEGCYRTYNLDGCCSSGQNCPKAGTEIETCVADGTTYKEGERFFPKDSCHKCVCGKGFKGNYEATYCRRINCATQMKFAIEYQQKCAPYYKKRDEDILCCPISWICPKLNETITTIDKRPENSKITCHFGDKNIKLGDGFITEDSKRCVCAIPPLLTCTDVPK